MNINKAAELTFEIAKSLHAQGYWRETGCPEMLFEHIESMMNRWSDDMSDTKKCRWLGWMQATVVAMTYPKANLSGMKFINEHWA